MNITTPIIIREMILRGDWPEEWIAQFKDAAVIRSTINIKAKDGTSLLVRDEDCDTETKISLEKP